MRLVTALTLFLAGVALLLGTACPVASTDRTTVVPYYGATYGTPGGFSAAEAKRVVELLESIDRRLEAIEQKTGNGPPAANLKAKGPDLAAVAKTHCAACHTPTKAEASGGGFILFAGGDAKALKPLSGREKTRVTEAVVGGTMPPDGRKKLTPAERSAFKW